MQVDGEWSFLRSTIGLNTRPQHLGRRIEPDDTCLACQQLARARTRQRATTERDHAVLATQDEFGDEQFLNVAKLLLAFVEQVGYRARCPTLDFAIDVDECASSKCSKLGANGRLAGSHKTDEHVGARVHFAAGDQGIRDR